MDELKNVRPGHIIEKLFAPIDLPGIKAHQKWDWSYFQKEEYAELIKYPDFFRPKALDNEILSVLGFEYNRVFGWTHKKYDLNLEERSSTASLYFYFETGPNDSREIIFEFAHQIQDFALCLTGKWIGYNT